VDAKAFAIKTILGQRHRIEIFKPVLKKCIFEKILNMGFNSIRIQNFRGIKDLHLSGLERINLFVGGNNTGKTSVLEAIFLATGMSNPQLALNIDAFRTLLHNEADDFRFVFHGLDYNNSPKLESVLNEKEERVLNIKPLLRAASNQDSRVFKKGTSNDITSTNAQGGLFAEGLSFEFEQKLPHAQRIIQKSTISLDDGRFTIQPPKTYKESLFGVFLSSTSNSFNSDTSKRLEKLLINKKKDEIIKLLNIVDPNIKDLQLGAGEIIYFDIGLDRFIPSNLSGDGSRRLLTILTTIYFTKGGIVLIDEIENGFHYKILRSIWEAIVKAAVEFDVQIFVTTHNIEALANLRDSLIQTNFQKYQSEVKTYSLLRNSAKELVAIEYNFSQFETALNNDNEIR
jgi:AAA15 family ATPase/GTPase